MSKKTLDSIVNHLQLVSQLHQKVKEQQLTEPLRQLQAWQTKRLLASHDELWQSKRFKPAMAFFIDELYGPTDFSQRDQEIARVVPKMAKILPEKALVSLESALHLNTLSFDLDMHVLEQLSGQSVDRDTYAKAYQACDNQAQREQQIVLLETLGIDLADVVKISGISALLMLSRKPAKMAGVESLHQFLETGFKAFKKLGKVEDFIQPIVDKERHLMHELFSDWQTNPLPQVNA